MAISELISQRNTQGGTASTDMTFSYPIAPTEENLLVVTFSYRLSGTNITSTPTGWVNIEKRQGNINTVISYKVASNNEPSSYTWSISASVKSAGTGMEFSSNGWATPIDKSASDSAATGTATRTTGNTTISTGLGELLIIGAHGCDTNATFSAHIGTNVTVAEISEVSSVGGSTSTRNTCSTSIGTTSTNAIFSIQATLSSSVDYAAIIGVFKENILATTSYANFFKIF